mmetsp:Transcript_101744/g.283302  ORF Transcript_101744/g.283302 Transcript_101744/m.283302 type:complete len:410 (+) Transcript_101744:271-1500(+)
MHCISCWRQSSHATGATTQGIVGGGAPKALLPPCRPKKLPEKQLQGLGLGPSLTIRPQLSHCSRQTAQGKHPLLSLGAADPIWAAILPPICAALLLRKNLVPVAVTLCMVPLDYVRKGLIPLRCGKLRLHHHMCQLCPCRESLDRAVGGVRRHHEVNSAASPGLGQRSWELGPCWYVRATTSLAWAPSTWPVAALPEARGAAAGARPPRRQVPPSLLPPATLMRHARCPDRRARAQRTPLHARLQLWLWPRPAHAPLPRLLRPAAPRLPPRLHAPTRPPCALRRWHAPAPPDGPPPHGLPRLLRASEATGDSRQRCTPHSSAQRARGSIAPALPPAPRKQLPGFVLCEVPSEAQQFPRLGHASGNRRQASPRWRPGHEAPCQHTGPRGQAPKLTRLALVYLPARPQATY